MSEKEFLAKLLVQMQNTVEVQNRQYRESGYQQLFHLGVANGLLLPVVLIERRLDELEAK